MEPMDIVDRLKVDIELLSMSPDENERLLSDTLKLALSEIETLRKRLKLNPIEQYWNHEDINRIDKYKQSYQKVKYPPINKL